VGLQIVHGPALTPELRRQMLDTWVAATNAGGALGLVAPTDDAAAAELADPLWRRLEAGTDDLVAAFVDDRLVGWFVLERRGGPLSPHWRTVKRLQVHPDEQGRGYGAALLAEAAAVGRRLGLEALHLTVRGGTGTEAFYAARGFVEVGRLPRALRLAPGDDRDEIHMHLDLRDG
jgi:GNAT superfamily N-acetyltransferase